MLSHFRRIVQSVVLTFPLVAAEPGEAHACSAFFCNEQRGFPDSTTLPANAGGVFFDPGARNTPVFDGMPPDGRPFLRLVQSGSEPVALAFTKTDISVAPFRRIALGLEAPLPVGATLELWASDDCNAAIFMDAGIGEPRLIQSWTVTEAIERPTALGHLELSDVLPAQIPQPVADGSCDAPAPTKSAIVTLAFDPSAAAYAGLFVFETIVDGAVFLPVVTASPFNSYGSQSHDFGGSWRGRGIDELYARCGAMVNGLTTGEHTVSMRARLADGTTFETAANTIVLSCPDGIDPVDARGPTDGGIRVDGGEPTPAIRGGGGCAAMGGARRSVTLIPAAIALLVVGRSWRRRRA